MNILKFKIALRGSVHINNCNLISESDELIALIIDTNITLGIISYIGYDEKNIPYIGLDCNDSLAGDTTEVAFPEYKNWTVFAYHWEKNCIHMCLLNK